LLTAPQLSEGSIGEQYKSRQWFQTNKTFDPTILMHSQKVVTPAPHYVRGRNDKKWSFLNFYEVVNIEKANKFANEKEERCIES